MKVKFDYTKFLLSGGAFWNMPQTQDNVRYSRGEVIIRPGSCGCQVKQLQKQLLRLGYALPVCGVDGIYGNETKKAVTEFQIDHGVIPDGIAGRETITKMKVCFYEEARCL